MERSHGWRPLQGVRRHVTGGASRSGRWQTSKTVPGQGTGQHHRNDGIAEPEDEWRCAEAKSSTQLEANPAQRCKGKTGSQGWQRSEIATTSVF